MTRLFLAASCVLWLPYGLMCWFNPDLLDELAGVAATSATGAIELRAMYGGLQTGLGALAGLACFRPSLQRPALVALAFLCGGLVTARLLGALVESELSSYTGMGLLFESLSTLFAVLLLVGPSSRPAVPAEGSPARS